MSRALMMLMLAGAVAVAPPALAGEDVLSALSEDYEADTQAADDEPEAPAVSDPLQRFNRVMFAFNDKLYFWLLKPVSRGYSKVVPAPARRGIDRFFDNLRTPIRLVNSLCQGKMAKAGVETERFLINTTFGFLGFEDAAADLRREAPSPEDTGQTFATWGVGGGPYLVWPLLGPANIRDSVGRVGDYLLDPVSYLSANSRNAAAAVRTEETVNHTSLHIGDYEEIKRDALDPYNFVRDIYGQNRAKRIEE